MTETPKRTRRTKPDDAVETIHETIPDVEPETETTVKTEKVTRHPETGKGYKAVVKASFLNVRERAEKESAIIADPLKQGQLVTIVKEGDEWGEISTGGYVMLQYVEKVR